VAPPGRPRLAAALAALAAAGVTVGIVVAAPHRVTVQHARASRTLARVSPPTPRRVHRSKPKPVAAAPSTISSATAAQIATRPATPRTTRSTPARTTTYTAAPSTTIPAAPTTTSTARQAAPRPPTAAVLEARGHQLMLDSAYTAAIPVLRQAIAAATPDDVNYAYALFDLGRSLRLAGDPQAAIAVLQRRLQIPNQTPIVLSELRLAQRALGPSSRLNGQARPEGGRAGALACR
jgi:hypothetical protein